MHVGKLYECNWINLLQLLKVWNSLIKMVTKIKWNHFSKSNKIRTTQIVCERTITVDPSEHYLIFFYIKLPRKKIKIKIKKYRNSVLNKWFEIYLCAVASRICLNLWIAESKLFDNEICVLEGHSFQACSILT
jgi:hypothetical protein